MPVSTLDMELIEDAFDLDLREVVGTDPASNHGKPMMTPPDTAFCPTATPCITQQGC
jgi:hypothetical protein